MLSVLSSPISWWRVSADRVGIVPAFSLDTSFSASDLCGIIPDHLGEVTDLFVFWLQVFTCREIVERDLSFVPLWLRRIQSQLTCRTSHRQVFTLSRALRTWCMSPCIVYSHMVGPYLSLTSNVKVRCDISSVFVKSSSVVVFSDSYFSVLKYTQNFTTIENPATIWDSNSHSCTFLVLC